MRKKVFIGLAILLSIGSGPGPLMANQTTQLVTAFKQESSLSNEREYLPIPAHTLAELEEELRDWWFKKNQARDDTARPANAYRRELIQEAMQMIYRDHQDHILQIEESDSYYGPTYTTLSSTALGNDVSGFVRSLADKGRIGILTEVHFRPGFKPVAWSISIVIRVGSERFVDLVHFSQ